LLSTLRGSTQRCLKKWLLMNLRFSQLNEMRAIRWSPEHGNRDAQNWRCFSSSLRRLGKWSIWRIR
jgi:hypothetical protein